MYIYILNSKKEYTTQEYMGMRLYTHRYEYAPSATLHTVTQNLSIDLINMYLLAREYRGHVHLAYAYHT
jgi:hypothetical protein